MNVLPITTGVALAPLALSAGRVAGSMAVGAAGGFLNLLRAAVAPPGETNVAAGTARPTGSAPSSEASGLRESVVRLTSAFRETVGRLLRERGVPLDRDIGVTRGADGKLALADEHPLREAIESAMNGSAAATDLFAALLEQRRRLAGVEPAAADQFAVKVGP